MHQAVEEEDVPATVKRRLEKERTKQRAKARKEREKEKERRATNPGARALGRVAERNKVLAWGPSPRLGAYKAVCESFGESSHGLWIPAEGTGFLAKRQTRRCQKERGGISSAIAL